MNQATGNMSLPHELWLFMKECKAWWISPIVVVMVLLGALLAFAEGSAAAQFIYSIF